MKNMHLKYMVFIIAVLPAIALMSCGNGEGPGPASPNNLKKIVLPGPQTDTGRPLMAALKDRKSTRSFSEKELPEQVLSNLLWAAFGINRPESGMRTAPSPIPKTEVISGPSTRSEFCPVSLLTFSCARHFAYRAEKPTFRSRKPVNPPPDTSPVPPEVVFD